MAFYEVFGGVLRSDIEFPELRAISAQPPDWTLRCGVSPILSSSGVRLGDEELVGGVFARLERSPYGFRLRFDDTGTFDVAGDGSVIDWTPAPNATLELVRSDVLGRVLSIALHAAGDLCLHASAAAIGDRAVAIIGAKGHGKSTLAMALVAHGAHFIADDTVRITNDPPRVAVGVPSLRLRPDAANRFGVETALADGEKVVVRDARASVAGERWRTLDALYVLAPRRSPDGESHARRRPLGPVEATLALVQHGKTATLLGKDEAGVVLARASAIVQRVPVYALEVTRDLAVLGDVATHLIEWHDRAKAPRCA
jgi:hypothetical protein